MLSFRTYRAIPFTLAALLLLGAAPAFGVVDRMLSCDDAQAALTSPQEQPRFVAWHEAEGRPHMRRSGGVEGLSLSLASQMSRGQRVAARILPAFSRQGCFFPTLRDSRVLLQL
jgi:hypothetical protein